MKQRYVSKAAIGLLAFSIAAVAGLQAAIADGPSPTPSAPSPKPPPDLARRIMEITDAVLEHHIDPPARQQMILSGIKALYRAAGVPVPYGLGRRVSAPATPEQLAALLVEVWPKSTAKPVPEKELEDALLDGLLGSIPGGADLISAKERKVAEQLEGNRYVGIHVALGMDDQAKRPKVFTVFEGGPADRAGVKEGDLLEAVDGVDTKGMPLLAVIDRTRGEEGTKVTIKVRQPRESKSRTLKITRGRHMHPTVFGIRRRPSGGWDIRLDGPDPLGYLKITEIGASTPHELRKLARQMESSGIRALVLDLRGLHGTSLHAAVLLADCLLDRNVIGRVRTAQGETTYQADPDALFRSWPMIVLVDVNTAGTAEWLAAALQDNHRATIVGTPTYGAMRARPVSGMVLQGSWDIRSRVTVGDGSWSIELTTGRLERSDGRPLSRPIDEMLGQPRMLAARPPGPDPIETGVKPDYVTAMTAGTVLMERARAKIPGQPRGAAPARDSAPAEDLAMEKAIELLRQSLKKSSVGNPSG